MTHIRVATDIDATPAEVWADVENISSHVEWMHDAEAITFTTEATSGTGAAFDCATKIGPIRLMDKMEVTEWTPGEAMGIRHVGFVAGVGRFTLTPLGDDGCHFAWDEALQFPWWMGGPLGGIVGGRILKAVWRRNLRLLAARFA